ncbi:MAG: hypothetical protein U0694_13885 [Anaerolineae bacterium]
MKRNVNPNFQQFVIFVALVSITIASAMIFVVNTNDNSIHIEAVRRFFAGGALYLSWEELSFANPPHSPPLIAPFVILGARWSAFWNMFFILYCFMNRRQPLIASLAKLLFIFTPPLLYVAAAANVTGIGAGIGLILLLSHRKGALRGLAWAYLLVRPQDGWAFLLYDAYRAWRERDYWAFVIAANVMALPIVSAPEIFAAWLRILPDVSPIVTSLSLTKSHGLFYGLLFFGLIVALRLYHWDNHRLRWRAPTGWPELERFWLCAVLVLVTGPYTVTICYGSCLSQCATSRHRAHADIVLPL